MTLDAWMRATGRTEREAAALFGCTKSHVQRLRQGRQMPGVRLLGAIVRRTHGWVGADDLRAARRAWLARPLPAAARRAA